MHVCYIHVGPDICVILTLRIKCTHTDSILRYNSTQSNFLESEERACAGASLHAGDYARCGMRV